MIRRAAIAVAIPSAIVLAFVALAWTAKGIGHLANMWFGWGESWDGDLQQMGGDILVLSILAILVSGWPVSAIAYWIFTGRHIDDRETRDQRSARERRERDVRRIAHRAIKCDIRDCDLCDEMAKHQAEAELRRMEPIDGELT